MFRRIGAIRSYRVAKAHTRHPVRMTRYQLTGIKLWLIGVWRRIVYVVRELLKHV